MENNGNQSFTGFFDAETRASFKLKRERHGFSRTALARLLGVDEVTIKRWECGPTLKVTGAAQEIIAAFLDGSLDRRLSRPAVAERKILVPVPVRKRIEKLARIYASCADFPELQEGILSGMREIHDMKHNRDGAPDGAGMQ